MRRATLVLGLLLAVSATALRAQALREQCVSDLLPSDAASCQSLADAAVSMPDRLAIAALGGNPVAGTASTLGMRMPGSPRWSIALRSTVARATLPPIGAEQALTPTLWSVNADASVGLFNGVNLAPTIGGFASIDVLASLGVISVPEDDGFERSAPLTWALGARIGILRESFTAPGVSVSALYRSLPDIAHGPEPQPQFEGRDQSVLSLRGTAGKRILGIGLTGGMGYDRTSADILVRHGGSDVPPVAPSTLEEARTSGRMSFFGNVSYTLMILNMAAELGWQESGDRPPGAHGDTGRGGLFGGIALRLAI
jgi:hypothetical protein